jgi:hypothetical protein
LARAAKSAAVSVDQAVFATDRSVVVKRYRFNRTGHKDRETGADIGRKQPCSIAAGRMFVHGCGCPGTAVSGIAACPQTTCQCASWQKQNGGFGAVRVSEQTFTIAPSVAGTDPMRTFASDSAPPDI